MISKSMNFSALALAFLFVAGGGGAQSNQKHERVSILRSPTDEKTVVRFFYQPPGDYFHAPLVFRAVQEGNALLNTGPMREEGRNAYISVAEMRELVQTLTHSNLAWQESETVETLGSYKKLSLDGVGLDDMDVRVVLSNGTTKAQIAPKAICKNLKALNSALKTPRAIWEFQGFRLNYGCKVPRFKPDAYPDH
jgi:hypothetical protein